jgi:hypothetical protein
VDSLTVWVDALDSQRRITGESGRIVVSSKSGNLQLTEFVFDNLVPKISMTSSSEIHRLDTIRVHADVPNLSAKSLIYEWSVGEDGWSRGTPDFAYIVPEKQAELLTIRVRAIRADGISSTESKSVSVISYPVKALLKVSTDSVAFGDTILLHFDEVDSPGSAITHRFISGFADALKNISVSGKDTVIRISSRAAMDPSITYCVENDWKVSDCSIVKFDLKKSFPKLTAKAEGTHFIVTWPNTLKDTITDICINGKCSVSRGDTSFTFERTRASSGLQRIEMTSKVEGYQFYSFVEVEVPTYSNDFERAGDSSGFPIVEYDSIFKSRAGKVVFDGGDGCDYARSFWGMDLREWDGIKSLTFRIRSSVAWDFTLEFAYLNWHHDVDWRNPVIVHSTPEGSLFTLSDSLADLASGALGISLMGPCMRDSLGSVIPGENFVVLDDIKLND